MTQPGWKERPDAVGLWVSSSKNNFANTVVEESGEFYFKGGTPVHHKAFASFRWFGPIPEDVPAPGAQE